MSGLEKAGLFSGGGVGESMMVGCKNAGGCSFYGALDMCFFREFCELG